MAFWLKKEEKKKLHQSTEGEHFNTISSSSRPPPWLPSFPLHSGCASSLDRCGPPREIAQRRRPWTLIQGDAPQWRLFLVGSGAPVNWGGASGQSTKAGHKCKHTEQGFEVFQRPVRCLSSELCRAVAAALLGGCSVRVSVPLGTIGCVWRLLSRATAHQARASSCEQWFCDLLQISHNAVAPNEGGISSPRP